MEFFVVMQLARDERVGVQRSERRTEGIREKREKRHPTSSFSKGARDSQSDKSRLCRIKLVSPSLNVIPIPKEFDSFKFLKQVKLLLTTSYGLQQNSLAW